MDMSIYVKQLKVKQSNANNMSNEKEQQSKIIKQFLVDRTFVKNSFGIEVYKDNDRGVHKFSMEPMLEDFIEYYQSATKALTRKEGKDGE